MPEIVLTAGSHGRHLTDIVLPSKEYTGYNPEADTPSGPVARGGSLPAS
jgi:hypothetical protein